MQESEPGRGRLRGFEVCGGLLAGAPVGLNVIGDPLTLSEAAHPGTLDGADVYEHILAAVIRLNETEAFLAIEPLYGTARHATLLFFQVRV